MAVEMKIMKKCVVKPKYFIYGCIFHELWSTQDDRQGISNFRMWILSSSMDGT